MSSRLVVFFDDELERSENLLFVARLRERLVYYRAVLIEARTLLAAERALRNPRVFLAIVDLMATDPRPSALGEAARRERDDLVGLDLVEQCRAGELGSSGRHIPIFVRTGRKEPWVRAKCSKSGSSGFFMAGSEDTLLIERIEAALKEGASGDAGR